MQKVVANGLKIDLHIHSKYSDGSHSPEEIVRIAKASNVQLISVCDHNLVQGTLEILPIAEKMGVKAIPGCEIDGIFEGQDIHILCYNADFSDEKINECKEKLQECSLKCIAANGFAPLLGLLSCSLIKTADEIL